MRGDAEYGDAGAVTVEQAIDEVQIARPAAARADGELTRQMRFGARREGGYLLVPDVEPLDLALSANRIGQPVEAVADDAVNALRFRATFEAAKRIPSRRSGGEVEPCPSAGVPL